MKRIVHWQGVFKAFEVLEPTVEKTLEILKGLRLRYESYHNVQIADDALESAVALSARYLPDRFLPDKAIDLMMKRLPAHD